MSIFGNIMSKLGFGDEQVEEGVKTADLAPAEVEAKIASSEVAQAAPAEAVDVMAVLAEKAAGSGLNWETSIVDLLKVLGLDSSLDSRKELATELGCPAEKMADSASMNIWLHKTVLQKLAANGGKVPAELL